MSLLLLSLLLSKVKVKSTPSLRPKTGVQQYVYNIFDEIFPTTLFFHIFQLCVGLDLPEGNYDTSNKEINLDKECTSQELKLLMKVPGLNQLSLASN